MQFGRERFHFHFRDRAHSPRLFQPGSQILRVFRPKISQRTLQRMRRQMKSGGVASFHGAVDRLALTRCFHQEGFENLREQTGVATHNVERQRPIHE